MPTVKKDAEAEAPPEVVTEVNHDGLRAVDSTTDADGNVLSVPRLATFAEQVAQLAPLVLAQAVGIIPGAAEGSVATDGAVITITLSPL